MDSLGDLPADQTTDLALKGETMKLLLTLLILLLTFTSALAQTSQVEFKWTQPDSTGGSQMPDGTICCKSPIPDGDLDKYEIFIATPTDTLYWGEVAAPADISEDATAIVPFEHFITSSIAVRAVNVRGITGPMSLWSDPFTVDPGPPEAAGKPAPIRVYFGG
jgi:hypothetical protein